MSLRARAEAPLCFDGQEEALSSAVVSIHDSLVATRGFAPLAFERKARGNYKPRSVRGCICLLHGIWCEARAAFF